jgi:hypothetical protein
MQVDTIASLIIDIIPGLPSLGKRILHLRQTAQINLPAETGPVDLSVLSGYCLLCGERSFLVAQAVDQKYLLVQCPTCGWKMHWGNNWCGRLVRWVFQHAGAVSLGRITSA